MKINKVSIAITLVVAVVVIAVGLNVMTVVGENYEPFYEESEEWCDAQGGELVNVNALLHGGLHCDVPNGTSVHMSEVVDVEE